MAGDLFKDKFGQLTDFKELQENGMWSESVLTFSHPDDDDDLDDFEEDEDDFEDDDEDEDEDEEFEEDDFDDDFVEDDWEDDDDDFPSIRSDIYVDIDDEF